MFSKAKSLLLLAREVLSRLCVGLAMTATVERALLLTQKALFLLIETAELNI
jgi:hypothetical protein